MPVANRFKKSDIMPKTARKWKIVASYLAGTLKKSKKLEQRSGSGHEMAGPAHQD